MIAHGTGHSTDWEEVKVHRPGVSGRSKKDQVGHLSEARNVPYKVMLRQLRHLQDTTGDEMWLKAWGE